jgi:hypothetical protein
MSGTPFSLEYEWMKEYQRPSERDAAAGGRGEKRARARERERERE